jgi:hypothetical protein
MSGNRTICISKSFRNYQRAIFLFFGILTILIGTSFSLVFASSWNIQTVEHWGDKGSCNSIAIDSLGRVHISHVEFDYFKRVYYLRYSFWDGNAWQSQYIVQTGDISPGKTSLALDSNDRPYICYTYARLGFRAYA